MIPFAMESHGAIGDSARQLLTKLASKVDSMSGHAFLQQAYARLSVALHAANASIAVGGLQRLRVQQLLVSSGDLPMSPGLGGHPSRRRTARRQARVRTHHVDLTAAFHGGYGKAMEAAA